MNKTLYASIGGFWLCSLLAAPGIGAALGGGAFSSPIPAAAAEITAQPGRVPSAVTGASSLESGSTLQPRVDLLGNEIEDAVADYRVDLGGDIYERHSPETAVPRLGSPSS